MIYLMKLGVGKHQELFETAECNMHIGTPSKITLSLFLVLKLLSDLATYL